MYNMYQVTKPNGEKLAWLDEDQAISEAIELSKKVGADQVLYYKLECEDEEEGREAEEWVVETRTYSNGDMISTSGERYQAPQYVPAPSAKSKKKGMSPEEKAAKDAAKAEAKAKRDEARAAAKAERNQAKEERKAAREAAKANRPPKASRSRLPDDGVIHLLVKENPKRVGSAARPRFDLYEEDMTVKAYKEANKDFGSIDLAWDVEHGFIKVTNADGSELTHAAPTNGSGEQESTEDSLPPVEASADEQGAAPTP